MLGALIGFLTVLIIYYWWNLRMKFGNFKKGVDDMPVKPFCIFIVLNFILISFFLFSITTILPDFLPKSYGRFIDRNPGLFLCVALLLSFCWNFYQYKRYSKIKKENNDVITKIEDVEL